ncbi:PREDICTED: receptor-like kinase TMK3 isoform X2 [Tarenaya hassleriana]|uniref:receptor-like kinase TMK3 isoform X2 n=1 Tax=Tarenaya hassleriana TaxID=28532 RepID=UPI00053C398D|nr:PREDICTED: receptor-like kinase TMK3 isoform X2 [Tarenaya hassleriana]
MCRRTSTMKTHLKTKLFVLPLVCCIVSVAFSTTDPNDLDVLNEFRNGLIRNGLKNPELLQWPDNGDDPCGQPSWKHVFCENTRVTQIQVQGLGLKGHLPYNLNKLSELINVGLQRNQFSGKLPSFSGLAKLQFAYLDYNAFDSIPGNFFDGLSSLQVLALDHNNFNSTAGWMFPESLQGSSQLSNLSCMSCNLVGPLPGFLGNMSSLTNLRLSDNSLSGEIPPSFGQSQLRTLSLNNQRSGGLTGSIDVLTLISSLEVLWLQGNQFSGPIPESRRRTHSLAPNPPVIHSGDRSDSDNLVKIAVVNDINGSTSTGRGSASKNSSSMAGSHVIESGNLVISLQVLRNVTENFAPENELGRGGFGIVYKGELEDGTKIAVKRMQAGVISTKALNEFHAEISVLSKVRHRHLVSLLCYSIEGNERMLVYEYMPQGALSKHLFHWKSLKLEPLSWKRRLNIALDVARGMEYLHSLAHQSFIHRDLKSSNILLGDDFRAKISDFGLVKLAPDTEKSVVTRLAGTFGYLAPEYAVMGKITTKVDVFSFGVVLMELLTGLMALDEDRPEESQYLASWFWHMKSDKQKLRAAIDNTLDVKDETFESICVVAELAGHCTAREPNQRPDMSHAVSVLCPLVENWKPLDDETEEYSGIDYSLPLNQMVKGWQEAEGKEISYVDLDDSKGSIPSRPTGFAESFTSADGR